jgi:hypothetical protein
MRFEGAVIQPHPDITRRSWSRQRRIVPKAEFTKGEANPRFVVTSLKRAECKPKYLYEKLYCARGEMENRIKECQLDLYAGRTSTATLRANQLRLWFASMAYVLLCAVRRIGCNIRDLPTRPAEPFVSSSSRSARSCASACAASRSRWRRAVPPPRPGAKPPSFSMPPQLRAVRPPDTRRRNASHRGIISRPTETTSSLPP